MPSEFFEQHFCCFNLGHLLCLGIYSVLIPPTRDVMRGKEQSLTYWGMGVQLP
jgi:hypothetical protein